MAILSNRIFWNVQREKQSVSDCSLKPAMLFKNRFLPRIKRWIREQSARFFEQLSQKMLLYFVVSIEVISIIFRHSISLLDFEKPT